MKLSKFNMELPEGGKTFIFNTLTQGMVSLETDVLKNLKGGWFAGLTQEELKFLEELGLLVHDEADEDRIFDLYFNQMRFANSILDITLLTTLSCNFACSYCYEGELTQGKKQMSPDTADNTIAWIKARALENHVSRIDIQYHGGEPLMNIPAIEKVGRELISFCAEKGIKLNCHMVSNGYLLNRE
ncbi:MAG: 4Fe-4S cluster-binding domain-containing protein, partial [Deltaproteobacteria bacterium]